MTPQRRKVVPEYFEAFLSHLPVNNIGANIQSVIFYGSKNTSSTFNENGVREEIRRTVTSKERLFTGILMHFTCKEVIHLIVNIILRDDYSKPKDF